MFDGQGLEVIGEHQGKEGRLVGMSLGYGLSVDAINAIDAEVGVSRRVQGRILVGH